MQNFACLCRRCNFWGDSVFLDGVLLEEHGDDGGGGDGDEGSSDAGEGGPEEQSNENGEAHEIDAGAHDAGGEHGVFEVQIDGVEDEDAEHLGPGVECSDSCGEEDGDDAAGDRDDVEEAHEEAKEQEVADVEEAEDDGARYAEDQHEEALAEEPFADLVLCSFEGSVETLALRGGEEREEEFVGVFAFEHEVDAEEGGGEEVEDVGEPEGERGEDVAGGGGECAFGTLGEGVDAELIREGDGFDTRDDFGDAMGDVAGEAAEIVEDGGKAHGEEESEDEGDCKDEQDDRYGARGVSAAELELGDAIDDRHEDDGEEGADIEDQQLLLEGPGEGEQKQQHDAEEDMAADRGAGLLLIRRQIRNQGCQLASPLGC